MHKVKVVAVDTTKRPVLRLGERKYFRYNLGSWVSCRFTQEPSDGIVADARKFTGAPDIGFVFKTDDGWHWFTVNQKKPVRLAKRILLGDAICTL